MKKTRYHINRNDSAAWKTWNSRDSVSSWGNYFYSLWFAILVHFMSKFWGRLALVRGRLAG